MWLEKLKKWLSEADKDVKNNLLDWKSSAAALPKGYFLDRGNLYNHIKDIAKKISGVGITGTDPVRV